MDLDEDEGVDQCAFVDEEVNNIAKEVVDEVIHNSAYKSNQVNQWTNSILENLIRQLTKLNKPFKYLATCVIMQKNGAGLHICSGAYWDGNTDGACSVRWENRTMYCLINVYALSI